MRIKANARENFGKSKYISRMHKMKKVSEERKKNPKQFSFCFNTPFFIAKSG
jgi:hypothetical protein